LASSSVDFNENIKPKEHNPNKADEMSNSFASKIYQVFLDRAGRLNHILRLNYWNVSTTSGCTSPNEVFSQYKSH